MRSPQAPAWYEGMTLDPHHFQQWDRSHRYALNARMRASVPFDWGFVELDIDENSLANGQFEIRSCKGVTRDGYVFDCPTKDPLPPPQNIKEHFPPSGEKLSVYFALPNEHQSGRNLHLEGAAQNRQIRFAAETATVSDENTGTDEREISICQPNFTVLFGDQNLHEFTVLPVADIVRGADGAYSLGIAHVPPCLAISASKTILRITRRVLESLVARGDSLSERRRQQPSGQIEFSTADVTLLGMLHTINRYIPIVNHYYKVRACHPETLYLCYVSLTGELMTFSSEEELRPSEIPPYEHENAGVCFAVLEEFITRLLQAAAASNFVRIPLEKQSENQCLARIADPGILSTAQLYLAVSGELPERKLIEELPYKIKIAAPQDLAGLIAAALPGLHVTYTPRPPIGLPSRPDIHYYKMEKSGRLWDGIVRNSSVAVFISADLRAARFELYALKLG